MIPEWPDSLPSAPLIEGFSTQGVDNIARAPVDLGPAKTRKRSTGEIKEVQCQVFLDDTQKEALEDFHAESLSQGAGRFKWKGLTDRVPGDYEEIKFQSKPRFQSRGLHWRVRLELIALPKAPPLELVRTNMTLNSLMDFSRASTGTYWDKDGVLQTAAIDQPRYTFDPATGEYEGVLFEEQRTNFLLFSNDMSGAAWVQSNLTVMPVSGAAPDGGDAYNLVADDGAEGTSARLEQESVSDDAVYCILLYVRAAGFDQIYVNPSDAAPDVLGTFDISSESWSSLGSNILESGFRDVGDGWKRIWLTWDDSIRLNDGGDVVLSANETGDGSSGVEVWGAQIEQGRMPSSLIITEDSQETRALESISGSADGLNAAAFTYVVDFIVPLDPDTNGNVFEIYGGDNNQRLTVDFQNGSLILAVLVDGTDILNAPSVSPGQRVRFSARLKPGDYALSVNGNAPVKMASSRGPIEPVKRVVGAREGPQDILNSTIRSANEYPRAMSDSELQQVSSL